MDFQGKRVVFLGDSITSSGKYVYALRSYFHKNRIKCEVYNRGIGGNRADMIEYLLQDEVVSLKPDYCFVCFGVNDLGIWLYDSFKNVDDKILSDRAKRDGRYFTSIERAVKLLKQKGIMPILMSPYPVDENLEERPDIPTLTDNKEKEDFIGPWFYKRKTFKNINDALYGYELGLKEIAKKENVLCYENFSYLQNHSKNKQGVFGVDGVHYLSAGQDLIAQGILEYMGFKNACAFEKDDMNDEIYELEQQERSYAFVRFNTFHKIYGDFTDQEMYENIKERLQSSDLPNWQRKSYTDFITYFGKIDELKEKIIQKTKQYCL